MYCHCMFLSVNSAFSYVFYSNAAYTFVSVNKSFLLTYLLTLYTLLKDASVVFKNLVNLLVLS